MSHTEKKNIFSKEMDLRCSQKIPEASFLECLLGFAQRIESTFSNEKADQEIYKNRFRWIKTELVLF